MKLRLFLLAMAATGISAPALATMPAEPCEAGPPGPATSLPRRPYSTAICTYDLKELYGRLGMIISEPNAQLSVASAISVFGLPLMDTDSDNAREASYTVLVSGKGGWQMELLLSESAFPLYDTLPPVFVPGARPERLVPIETLDVRYHITITLPDEAGTPDHCMTAADAAALAIASGRRDDTLRTGLQVTDLGPGSPTFLGANDQRFSLFLGRQAGRLPTSAEMKTNCVTRAFFMQPPQKG